MKTALNRVSPGTSPKRSTSNRIAPTGANTGIVTVRVESLVLPTYFPAPPDLNPMFLERRVYQGSNGKVYPLPFTDRISEQPVNRKWKAIWIENEFLRVLLLPELGGRIHAIQDKSNGYDLIYNQHVIKPALVGLAGPWISGGIEFNWPQHHRPATFLPVDFDVERHPDGSVTVWCSDHDPMARMKGMHGLCLHPARAIVELKVRAYNRTLLPQTFLWWANVATVVHEAYQSFFPPDVSSVADHARRSMSEYPLADATYYGVDYRERAKHGVPPSEVPPAYVPPHCSTSRNGDIPHYAPNDISFYANIPTPCSYMCIGSKEDFFGGYDYKANAGIVHIANHHISPGKKQWTWGNHPFGYAWDRNLTDPDLNGEYRPYIEIMAGVYTDNQPDFSFLQPGETKTWSQFWYPIQNIGPAHHANANAALNLALSTRRFKLGVAVTSRHAAARIRLERASGAAEWIADLAPDRSFILDSPQPRRPWKLGETTVRILSSDGQELISYTPAPRPVRPLPAPASEPPAPRFLASADELYLTGLHLEQYRHATRSPLDYWKEALSRDPGDYRCNNAIGLWHLRRGEFESAEPLFRKSIERLTLRNANPYDGEPYYNLGLCLRYLHAQSTPFPCPTLRNDRQNLSRSLSPLLEEAYAAFYKATWNQPWAAAAYHQIAELDCLNCNWALALDHLTRSLRFNTENLRARNLQVLVLRRTGDSVEAARILNETLQKDRLDWWARHLSRHTVSCDLQTRIDIAHDYARAGFFAEAIDLLLLTRPPAVDLPDQNWGAEPLVAYTLGWLEAKRGNTARALAHFERASQIPRDYCFPARVEEIEILKKAINCNPRDASAPYYLGNLLYDRRRHSEAIRLWERSAALAPGSSVVWRNLGIGYYNVQRNASKALAAYNRALKANPTDARLLFERDQLCKRLAKKPLNRLRFLECNLPLVALRDDLSIELCALYNQTGQHQKALQLVSSRRFQPWEGGEGGPLGQHVRSHLALGRKALSAGDSSSALRHFQTALSAPTNLGEAKHLLVNQSDIHFWIGCAHHTLHNSSAARQHWLLAANQKGDFQEMSLRSFSEMSYYSACALQKLGQVRKATSLLKKLLAYAERMFKAEPKIDYFATSLPTMLLFEDDLKLRQETTALFLQAQAQIGLGNRLRGRALLRRVLTRDPSHPLASDLLAETAGAPKP